MTLCFSVLGVGSQESRVLDIERDWPIGLKGNKVDDSLLAQSSCSSAPFSGDES